MRFSVVGPGRVGAAMARALVEAGWTLCGVASRRLESARKAVAWIGAGTAYGRAEDAAASAGVVLIAVPDAAVGHVARALAEVSAGEGAVALHTSGALSSDVLAPMRAKGWAVGSMHPLQTFAGPEEVMDLLAGAFFCCEGDELALAVARTAVRDLGGHFQTISPQGKILYHAAACVASNFLVALEASAAELLTRAGVPKSEALRMLLPLIRGTVANLARVGLPRALTGPVARRDWGTVEAHLAEMGRQAPELLPLYRALCERTTTLARDLSEPAKRDEV